VNDAEKAVLDQKVEREYRDWREEKASREASSEPVTVMAEVREDGRFVPLLGPSKFTLRNGDTLILDLHSTQPGSPPPTYVALYADEPPDEPAVSANGYARRKMPLSTDVTRVVVPMSFYTPPDLWPKPSFWRRITHFWSRVHFRWPVSFN
jgi:hypothetical protein